MTTNGAGVRIGELSERTGVPTRMLRYYEEQGVLTPGRQDNGYRFYGEPAVDRVLQVRELLEAGLTTRIVRDVLPCLERQAQERQGQRQRHAHGLHDDAADECPSTEDTSALRRQLVSIERRIEILRRNHQAIGEYLAAVDGTTRT